MSTLSGQRFAGCYLRSVCIQGKPRLFALTPIHPDYLGYSENIMEITPRRGYCLTTAFSWLAADFVSAP